MRANLLNLSAEPDQKIYGWLERADALRSAHTVISLPDTCPGKSPLPTGTGYLTQSAQWRRFAVSDVGCGIAVVRSTLTLADIETEEFRRTWSALCDDLAANRNKGLGDLGSGNHFLDAVCSYTDESICFVVHTGSRAESGIVDHLVDSPARFDTEFERVKGWARDNRAAVLEQVRRRFGAFRELYPGIAVLDRDHNHFEELDAGVLIRKGAQRVRPGELALVPSNLLDDMVIVRATAQVSETLNCLPHGTGRTMSRSDAKKAAADFDFGEMRRRIIIPDRIEDASLRTEAPICYRRLDDGLSRIRHLVEEQERFVPVAYIGQL